MSTPRRSQGIDDGQRGAILPLMAILLVVLMGAAAMAVDLGWLYWQSIEIQHGADSAALAGVVYEPDMRTEAKSESVAAALQNGYDDSDAGTTVEVVDFVDDDTSVVRESMLRVTITHEVQTFFLKVFGLNHFDIQRTAVAEYVLPLALGSPEAYFGDDPAQEIYPGFTADSTSNYQAKAGGNRFGALCLHTGFGAGCKHDTSGGGGAAQGSNPEGRIPSGWGTAAAQGGYLFGIDVPEGSSGLKVEIFNAPNYAIRKNKESPTPATGTGNFLGDTKYNWWNVEVTTWFMLYGPDPTPYDTTDGNELLCSVAYQERLPQWSTGADSPPNSSAYELDFGSLAPVDLSWDDSWLEFDEVRAAGHQNILDLMWEDMSNPYIAGNMPGDYVDSDCSQATFDRGPGTYVLRVLDEYDNSGETDTRDSWRGSNKYTLRTSTTAGDQPAIYAIEDMVMTAARNTAETDYYLAKVDSKYAGKDLIIELWDVGDIYSGPGTDNFTIVDGNLDAVDCEWWATNGDSGSGTCNIVASDLVYNDELITMTIAIPDDYTCDGDGCWWQIEYDYAGLVKDTTTWTAYVDGNPIRIVE